MIYNLDEYKRLLREVVDRRKFKVKLLYHLIRSRIDVDRPAFIINKKVYSLRDIKDALDRDDPLITKIVKAGIDRLNDILNLKEVKK